MTASASTARSGRRRHHAVLFVVGLGLTSASLSSGFIWASQGRSRRVVLAATGAWTGYLLAHWAATGTLVDHSDGTGLPDWDDLHLGSARRYLGFLVGIGALVSGMVIGVRTIAAGDHLWTNVGGVLFLGGYVIAHYAVTDELL